MHLQWRSPVQVAFLFLAAYWSPSSPQKIEEQPTVANTPNSVSAGQRLCPSTTNGLKPRENAPRPSDRPSHPQLLSLPDSAEIRRLTTRHTFASLDAGAGRSANSPHGNQLWPRRTRLIHKRGATVRHEFPQVTAAFRNESAPSSCSPRKARAGLSSLVLARDDDHS